MRITFVSNYMSHHQKPFSEALVSMPTIDYTFIQTEPMEEERVAMGWDASSAEQPYVKKLWEDEEACKRLILDSEVVIFGWTGREELIVPRLLAGKLTFRNSERIYKEGQWKAISPRGLLQKYKDYTKYRRYPYYLLCAGGYVASDFSVIRAFPEKKLKWGYFPPLCEYTESFLSDKQDRQGKPVRLLWAGRFIDWKHPEVAIEVAKALRKKEIPFQLTMVGGGEMEGMLHQMVEEADLTSSVTFTGYARPEEVRGYMEQAQIYLFTSDYKEGWGAVLNEAMNSGCAVVCNKALGAAPFLIQDGVNGLTYANGDVKACIRQVEKLCLEEAFCEKLGKAAYQSIKTTWNAELAAKAFVEVCAKLLEKGALILPKEGPMSVAPNISPREALK